MKNRPIGVFDSGIGGLTVFNQIRQALPKEDIIYFGDTAHVPYGSKSKDVIIKFSVSNILFLLKRKVKIVVVACNTASALALNHLKDIFSTPVLGVIDAGVSKALKVSAKKKIGIIGTKATVLSKSYEKQILAKSKSALVYSKSCPLFVPMVENGMLAGDIADDVIKLYLKSLKKKGIDALVLGCTHYPMLKPRIKAYLKGVDIVDSSQEMAMRTKMILKQRGLLTDFKKKGKEEFYVTDDPVGFAKEAKLFLKRNIKKPKVVNV